MKLFLVCFLVIVFAALCMAVGVIAGRRPIGSGCASIGGLTGTEIGCEICGGEREADRQSPVATR